MNTRRWLVGLVLMATAAAYAGEELAETGHPAPVFRLPMYNPPPSGSTFLGIDKYVGPEAQDKQTKVLLVSFMASFCAPCKKEMPYLEALHEKYKDQGLRVMSVSIDTEEDGQKQIEALIAQNKVTYPVLKDRFNLVARRWLGNKSPLPSVFLVKPDGTILAAHRGYSDDIARVLEHEVLTELGLTAAADKP